MGRNRNGFFIAIAFRLLDLFVNFVVGKALNITIRNNPKTQYNSKIMISNKLQDAINGQIVAEMWSANLYLSMSFYFDREGYTGFASWMKAQSKEEMEHAYEMADFLHKRGGIAHIGDITSVPQNWESPLQAFEEVYAHECKVSAMINALLDLAEEEKDRAAQDFMWGFVKEQVEEEATASGIVDRIRRMGGTDIFGLDQEYGKRK